MRNYLESNLESVILVLLMLGVGLQRLPWAVANSIYGISVALFLFWCFVKRHTLKELLKSNLWIIKAYSLFLMCFFPAVLLSDSIGGSANSFWKMFIVRSLPFLMVMLLTKNERIIEVLLACLMLIESVDAAVALYQAFSTKVYTAAGFGSHYLHLAGHLACFIPVVLVISLDECFSSKLRAFAGVVCLILIACAFAGSKSRALWLIMLTILPLILFHYRNKVFQYKSCFMVVFVSLILAGGFFLSSERNLQRLMSATNTTTNGSNIERLYMWRAATNIILDYPVCGVGLGNYDRIYNNSYELAAIPTKGYHHPHNSYLFLGAEAGLLGLLAIIVSTLAILYTSFVQWYKSGCVYYYLIGVSWLGFSIFGMIEPIVSFRAHVMLMMFLSGLFYVGIKLKKQEKELGHE